MVLLTIHNCHPAAVDVVAATGGGQVYLPAGTYLVENQDADSTVSNGWVSDTSKSCPATSISKEPPVRLSSKRLKH